MKQKVVRLGIILGIAPVAILLITNGVNVLFAIGTWVHWSILTLYGSSLIFLGTYDLILVNNGIKNLLKTEFGKIKFKKIQLEGEKGKEFFEQHKKSKKQMLGLLSIAVGVITLLLTSTIS